jgi:acyl carrier protein
MTEAEVYAGLTQIFTDLFDNETIVLKPETTAADVDGWDSFNNLNIIAAAEHRFGVKINTREIEKLTNLGVLASLILKKTG